MYIKRAVHAKEAFSIGSGSKTPCLISSSDERDPLMTTVTKSRLTTTADGYNNPVCILRIYPPSPFSWPNEHTNRTLCLEYFDKPQCCPPGATLAFAKTPASNNYSRNNGALVATTKAGSSAASRSLLITSPNASSNGKNETLVLPYSVGATDTYGSPGSGSELALLRQKKDLPLPIKGDVPDHLLLPSPASNRAISPSRIAASLAASRSTPIITPNHSGQQPTLPPAIHAKASGSARSPRRSSGRSPRRSVSYSRDTPDDVLDTSSIPPTTSLIGMFERSTGNAPLVKRAKSTTTIARPDALEAESPKRARDHSVLVQQQLGHSPKPCLSHWRANHTKNSGAPSKGPKLSVDKIDTDDVSSDDSFVSALDQRPQSALARRNRPTSMPTSADARAIDSLANAIVASSLASSRAASPSKSLLNLASPMPPPRRGNAGLFPQRNAFNSRTPSPVKGFRQTMRKPPKDEVEEDPNMLRKGKINIMKKHPNKHHEGDRKRWRDAITERERKRYEAVWASNKGLYVTSSAPSFPLPPGSDTQPDVPNPTNSSDLVCNIVVRDIWSRSRLGDSILSEVWELVDRSGSGRLSREEFVVGLWLIDQRLKGRKLPIRVGDSVWSSISSLGGITVRGNGRKR